MEISGERQTAYDAIRRQRRWFQLVDSYILERPQKAIAALAARTHVTEWSGHAYRFLRYRGLSPAAVSVCVPSRCWSAGEVRADARNGLEFQEVRRHVHSFGCVRYQRFCVENQRVRVGVRA